MVRLWLRAGHSRFFHHELEDRLSPWGIDIEEFVTLFDAATRHISGAPVPVIIIIYDDDTYDFEFGGASSISPPLDPEAMDPYGCS